VIVEGSCLCGTVGFEARLPSARFVNGHCSRCRKATGSTSAANAIVRPDALRWTRDAEEVARFDLPTARASPPRSAAPAGRRCRTPPGAAAK
jgi:hypothetical protein